MWLDLFPLNWGAICQLYHKKNWKNVHTLIQTTHAPTMATSPTRVEEASIVKKLIRVVLMVANDHHTEVEATRHCCDRIHTFKISNVSNFQTFSLSFLDVFNGSKHGGAH